MNGQPEKMYLFTYENRSYYVAAPAEHLAWARLSGFIGQPVAALREGWQFKVKEVPLAGLIIEVR